MKILKAIILGLAVSLTCKANSADTTTIKIDELVVSSKLKTVNKSPLRLKNIDSDEIIRISTGKTYPELLSNIPSIYATSETGSYGDAKINIRGFKQENISVILNGIPISGLTSGSMFWNNWLGLSDATATIQLQKGIGSSMLSDNSMGGTINIITKSPQTKESANFSFSRTNFGTNKIYGEYSSAESKRGWALSLMASYVWGHSWIECSDVNSWAFMISASKKINKNHSLLFTSMGSPEKHQQRSSRLSFEEVEKYGIEYSKNWGMYNGKAKTISENNYFKPYFIFNHFYTNHKNIKWDNALYATIGNGGGIWTESKGKKIIAYQKNGHIDWDAIVAENKAQSSGESQNILSDYMAGHYQFGAKSELQFKINQALAIDAGIHYQHYRTWEKEKITDLLGGEYWFEDYENNSLAGVANRETKKQVGDYIRTRNGKIINYGTLYMLSTLEFKNLILKLGGTLNASTHQRWDKYNYVENNKSRTAKGFGGSIKSGALIKINRNNSIYVNAAFYSRMPYSSTYFASGNNQISKNVKNEKNILGEIGYRFVHSRGNIEITAYSAYWKNKTITSNPYKPLEEDAYRFAVNGLDAFHKGIEIEANYRVNIFLNFSAFAALADWRWKNNVHATIYDDYSGQIADQIDIYCNDLPVGDAPQTQVGATLEFNPTKLFSTNSLNNLSIRFNWNLSSRYWADFEPASRTESNAPKPFKIPSYSVFNINANFKMPINISATTKIYADIFFALNNIFDKMYIERGKDGNNHKRETFSGYWGAGRNFNFGIRMSLTK